MSTSLRTDGCFRRPNTGSSTGTEKVQLVQECAQDASLALSRPVPAGDPPPQPRPSPTPLVFLVEGSKVTRALAVEELHFAETLE